MSAVERATEAMTASMLKNRQRWAEMTPRRLAQALADAGLLCSDADRAVLDAADEWLDGMTDHEATGLAGWEVRLRAAVRARRETQP